MICVWILILQSQFLILIISNMYHVHSLIHTVQCDTVIKVTEKILNIPIHTILCHHISHNVSMFFITMFYNASRMISIQ